MKPGDCVVFWENKGDPFFVGSQTVASSGKVAMVRTAVTGLIGSPIRAKFILARASHITTWQGHGSEPFTLLTKTVVLQFPNPISYQNMVLRDGNYDIDHFIQNLGTAGSSFDLWQGTINCIIVG
jgi:hypothetical protein